jgi:hypothetical protein
MEPKMKAPSTPEAAAQKSALPVISGRPAPSASASPTTPVANPEMPIRPPIPRSLKPTELTSTCVAIATPANTASNRPEFKASPLPTDSSGRR